MKQQVGKARKSEQWVEHWLDQRLLRSRKAKALGVDYVSVQENECSEWASVSTMGTWIRQEIGEWTAMLRVVPSRNANPAVAEIRMFPREPEADRRAAGLSPEEWSGCYTGIHTHVPGSGLTARLLRAVQVGFAVRGATAYTRQVFDLNPALPHGWQLMVWPHRPASRGQRGGRKRIADDQLVLVANAYTQNCEQPNPVQLAAKAYKLKTTQVRDWLHIARERGLLCPADSTRPAGRLTKKGQELLEAIKARVVAKREVARTQKGGRNP